MKRSEFTVRLRAGLKGNVPSSEVERQVEYYNEMILDLMEEGQSEEAAVNQVGDPNTIVFDTMDNYTQGTSTAHVPARRSSGQRWLIILLLIIGSPLWGSILIAALCCLLAAEMLLWCIPFTGLVTAGGFGAGGVSAIVMGIAAMIQVPFIGVTELGMGLFCLGVAVFIGWVTVKISGVFMRGHVLLMHWVAEQFRRGKVVLA